MSPQDKIQVLTAPFSSISLKKGDVLLSSDTQSSVLFYCVSGYVRQSTISKTGEVLYLHIYKPGSLFVLSWATNSITNRYTFEAITPVEIKKVPRAIVRDFLSINSDVLLYFTKKVLLGVDGLLARMESLVLDSAYSKTVQLFLYFANSLGKKEGASGTVVDLPITHREIASWIGTTRETASLQVEALVKKGLVLFERKRFVIPQISLLEKELELAQ